MMARVEAGVERRCKGELGAIRRALTAQTLLDDLLEGRASVWGARNEESADDSPKTMLNGERVFLRGCRRRRTRITYSSTLELAMKVSIIRETWGTG